MIKRILFICTALFLTGCVTPPKVITKQQAFPKVYAEKPLSILVVPAINETTAADAIDLYSTTIAQPLAEAGYYVLSVPYTKKFLERQGVVEGAQATQVPLEKYKQLFGADVVLFVTLKKWDTNYTVLSGDVTVSAKADMYSTTTKEKLWNYDSTFVYVTSGNSGNLFADLVATAIQTALTDYVPVARIVNSNMIHSMPVGKYHKRYDTDQKDMAVLEYKVKPKQGK
ncbi:MAG: GNA1162 family protein [Parashewanella sp.]